MKSETIKPSAQDLSSLIGKQFLPLNRLMVKHGLKIQHAYLLSHLAESEEETTMTDISRILGYSTAAATGTIDRLEKKGLVCRSHSQTDRRKVIVKLTDAGWKFFQEEIIELLREVIDLEDIVKTRAALARPPVSPARSLSVSAA